MIKFLIVSRHKPHEDQQTFFYNWAIIHVALMLTTPIVFSTFRRYVQHFGINGISDELLWHPQSRMGWESFADHWLDDFDAMSRNIRDPGYRARMQPHMFGDSNIVIEFNSGYSLYEAPDFRSGGVKLVHYLKKRAGLSQAEFVDRWRNEHGPAVVKALEPLGILRKYVQSPKLDFDRSVFAGTFFEKAHFGQYDGVEEYWLSGIEALTVLANDARAMQTIRTSDARLVAPEESFAMVVKERVVFDNTLVSDPSPGPAVLIPGSLEQRIDAQGYAGWNVP